ncbi:MAG: protein kinase [Clostridium sp.]|nr:protein kinase [Clostridium sp.]
MNIWTSEEIDKILIQLDEMGVLFKKYSFAYENGKLKLIGSGGFAYVYEAVKRLKHKGSFAIKVIGFNNKGVDSKAFNEIVEAQKYIGDVYNNVVKIYDYKELWVILNEEDNVVDVLEDEPKQLSKMSLKLQFIVMEKITPVIQKTKFGKIKMTPKILLDGNEKEILKLAYDIGLALQRAHNNNIIYRDVKLENIFYSQKKKQYKLGDFGIAEKTPDGFASTVAFTKGYAAPELINRRKNDRYDNTVDIYSFGMMLFVLTNELKFPILNTNDENADIQYSKGFILPRPKNDISEGLYRLMVKACMYDPEQRYQSMEEVILDIEKLMYSFNLGYRKEHKKLSLVVGSIFLVLGTIAWKMTLVPEMNITFSLWEYIFLSGCVFKGILKAFNKDTFFESFLMFFLGIYLIISTGFTFGKFIFILCMVFSDGVLSGYFGVGAFIINFASLLQFASESDLSMYREYNWVAITFISLAVVLLGQYFILILEERKNIQKYYEKIFWPVIFLLYFELIFCIQNETVRSIFREILGDKIFYTMQEVDLQKVGIFGLIFCIFWMVREKILIFYQKSSLKK